MKFKQILTASFICVSASLNAAATHMIVELKTGEKYDFELAEKPVVTFAGADLVVNGSAATSYSIGGIKNYHFEEEPTGTEQLSGKIQLVAMEGDQVEVRNLEEGTGVTLHSVSGAVLYETKVDANGVAIVSLPQQKGVYILSVKNNSIKVIRK